MKATKKRLSGGLPSTPDSTMPRLRDRGRSSAGGRGDGVPDYRDPDSDDDTSSDNDEAYDRNGDGNSDVPPSGTDSDGDGDAVAGAGALGREAHAGAVIGARAPAGGGCGWNAGASR